MKTRLAPAVTGLALLIAACLATFALGAPFWVLPLPMIPPGARTSLVTAVMATLAIPLGPLLRSMPPLHAYGWDITGSMLGIAGFTILSAAGTTPVVWFVVAAILYDIPLLPF